MTHPEGAAGLPISGITKSVNLLTSYFEPTLQSLNRDTILKAKVTFTITDSTRVFLPRGRILVTILLQIQTLAPQTGSCDQIPRFNV